MKCCITEMLLNASCHLGLHCLPKYIYIVSSIQRVKHLKYHGEMSILN